MYNKYIQVIILKNMIWDLIGSETVSLYNNETWSMDMCSGRGRSGITEK